MATMSPVCGDRRNALTPLCRKAAGDFERAAELFAKAAPHR